MTDDDIEYEAARKKLDPNAGNFFVLLLAGEGTYWDGTEWVGDYRLAVLYPPAPADGHGRAAADREARAKAGDDCMVFYIPRRKPPKT